MDISPQTLSLSEFREVVSMNKSSGQRDLLLPATEKHHIIFQWRFTKRLTLLDRQQRSAEVGQ